MSELAGIERAPEVDEEVALLRWKALVATMTPKRAARFLVELAESAGRQESLNSVPVLRLSPREAEQRAAKRQAAHIVLAELPELGAAARSE